MCGVESAGFEQDEEKMDWAVTKDVMLHAYMFTQSGIRCSTAAMRWARSMIILTKKIRIRRRIPAISTEENSTGIW